MAYYLNQLLYLKLPYHDALMLKKDFKQSQKVASISDSAIHCSFYNLDTNVSSVHCIWWSVDRATVTSLVIDFLQSICNTMEIVLLCAAF